MVLASSLKQRASAPILLIPYDTGRDNLLDRYKYPLNVSNIMLVCTDYNY